MDERDRERQINKDKTAFLIIITIALQRKNDRGSGVPSFSLHPDEMTERLKGVSVSLRGRKKKKIERRRNYEPSYFRGENKINKDIQHHI